MHALANVSVCGLVFLYFIHSLGTHFDGWRVLKGVRFSNSLMLLDVSVYLLLSWVITVFLAPLSNAACNKANLSTHTYSQSFHSSYFNTIHHHERHMKSNLALKLSATILTIPSAYVQQSHSLLAKWQLFASFHFTFLQVAFLNNKPFLVTCWGWVEMILL